MIKFKTPITIATSKKGKCSIFNLKLAKQVYESQKFECYLLHNLIALHHIDIYYSDMQALTCIMAYGQCI